MQNLVIIGNGFDLSHGLKTSYTDFITHLVDNHCENSHMYDDLFTIPNHINNFKEFMKYVRDVNVYSDIHSIVKNVFLGTLIEDIALQNWCDIEQKYFSTLMKISDNYELKRLNSEFSVLKKYLENYLNTEQQSINTIDSYTKYFGSIDSSETLILNFNYTKVLKEYFPFYKNAKVVNIHGEINNNDNPIIFGYAANDEESRALIEKNNNNYMRNIKKHNYKRTSNENDLRNYLSNMKYIDVTILGHSCGISDKHILNQIFNHPKIHSIRLFYYSEYEYYFQTQVNIDRIMENSANFDKLISFSDSYKMPQKGDDSYLTYKEIVETIQRDQKATYQKLLNGENRTKIRRRN